MSSPAKKKPFKLRLPDVDNAKLLADTAQHTGMSGFLKVMEAPCRHAENVALASVPELYGVEINYWCKVMAVMLDIDPALPNEEIIKQSVVGGSKSSERYWLMMTWLHCVHMNNSWSRCVIGSRMVTNTPAKFLVIDQPDADIWSEDERLTLKFVKATFEWQMTDELWDAAAKAWGIKWILSCLDMLALYYGWSLRFSAVGLDRVEGWNGSTPLDVFLGYANDPDVHGKAAKT